MLEGILLSVVLAYVFGYVILKICHWLIDWETERDIEKIRCHTAELREQTEMRMQSELDRSPVPISEHSQSVAQPPSVTE